MKFPRYWLPLMLYAGTIFGLSSMPGDGFPPLPLPVDWLPSWVVKNPDKIIHAVMYGIMGWLCLRATARGWEMDFPRAAWVAFFMASGYGFSDEFHQIFVPKRSSTLGDWVADSVGALLVIACLYRFYSRPGKKNH